MSTICAQCGAQIPDASAPCPNCGQEQVITRPELGATRGIPDNIAAALAYFSFIPAIIFLVIEPFSRNRFIRFHSLQCLLLTIAMGVLGLALKITLIILSIIPVLGRLVGILLLLVVPIGCFILWLVLVVKAFQGETFKLPLIGDWAERQSQHMD
jgi:uncharacterized membrane protein